MTRRRDFSAAERNQVVQFLLEGGKNSRMSRWRIIAAVLKFNSSERTISRLWSTANKQQAAGQVINLQNGKHNPRAKRVTIDLEFIASLDPHKRSTITGSTIYWKLVTLKECKS